MSDENPDQFPRNVWLAADFDPPQEVEFELELDRDMTSLTGLVHAVRRALWAGGWSTAMLTFQGWAVLTTQSAAFHYAGVARQHRDGRWVLRLRLLEE